MADSSLLAVHVEIQLILICVRIMIYAPSNKTNYVACIRKSPPSLQF